MTQGSIGAIAIAVTVAAAISIPLAAAWRPRPPVHPDAAALRDTGWRVSLAKWEAFRLAAVIAGVTVAAVLGLFPLAGVALGAAPSIIVRSRAAVARDRARRELPRLLAATHGMLRSGVALPQALRRAVAASGDAIARRPFEAALAQFDLGDPLDGSLRQAARDVTDPRVVSLLHTLALGVAERLPIDRAASLLELVAERADHDDRLDAEVRARAAGVRMQSYLLAGVVPAMALYLAATMPGLAATLGSGVGKSVLIPVAVALELAGIVLGRRIVRTVSR
ncbi:MAG TPA: type II secretion system F family protein [Candidatus Limnocylindria bacterium]